MARKIIRLFAEKRMEITDVKEREAMTDMIYRAYNQKCSSEKSITMILEFGGWAR
jgi:hypothetical protein